MVIIFVVSTSNYTLWNKKKYIQKSTGNQTEKIRNINILILGLYDTLIEREFMFSIVPNYKEWFVRVCRLCFVKVFEQIAWQCRVLFARLRKLLAWNQNNLIFFAQAANACAVWVLVCTNKPQYYSELTPCGCASCRYL